MNYRWINGWEATDAEWNQIDNIIYSRGWMTLNKNTSRIRVAEEEGRIIGFFCLQQIPHTEPMYVARKYWGQGVAEKLADDMMEFLKEINARGWVLIAENPTVEKLCLERKMVKVNYPVYISLGQEES